MLTPEAPPLARKPITPPPHLRFPRFSPKKFTAEWERARREDPRFSVANLMIAAGVRSERTLWNWKNGIGKPDADQAVALASALGLPPLGLYE